MIAALALLLAPQDPDAWIRDLESPSTGRAYRALERLAALPEARERLQARESTAQGRLRTHLQAALRGPLGKSPRVTLRKTPRTALEHLQDLAKQSGLLLNLETLLDEKLPELTLEAADLLPLEALDLVCRSAELSTSFEADQILIFTGGGVHAPVSRLGPCQFSLLRAVQKRAVEFVRPARSWITLDFGLCFEHGLPLMDVAGVRILEAVDDRGQDLLPRAGELLPDDEEGEPLDEVGDAVARPEAFQDHVVTIDLRALSPGAKGIALLRGEALLRLPKSLRKVELAKPLPDATASAPGLSVVVRKLIPEESRLLLDVEVPAGRRFLVSGFRADGRLERTHATILEKPERGPFRVSLEVQPRPSARGILLEKQAPQSLLELLRVELAEDVVERPVPFEFRGVELR